MKRGEQYLHDSFSYSSSVRQQCFTLSRSHPLELSLATVILTVVSIFNVRTFIVILCRCGKLFSSFSAVIRLIVDINLGAQACIERPQECSGRKLDAVVETADSIDFSGRIVLGCELLRLHVVCGYIVTIICEDLYRLISSVAT